MTLGFFVLHELRLTSGDDSTRLLAAARLARMPRSEDEQVLPLLVSIDDRRAVACVRRVPTLPESDDAGVRIRMALAPEPESSAPPRYYKERGGLTGRRGVRSYYRMAVTESGTNEQAKVLVDMPVLSPSMPSLSRSGGTADAGLLWIGTPIASETGLLVITGHQDASAYSDGDAPDWPLPMSRDLGVRIYESVRP